VKWITRSRATIDRIACPWLIKKFIDEDAEIIYVAADKVEELAKELNAIPFDVRGVGKYYHRGEGKEMKCTFHVLVEEFGLDKEMWGPALLMMADIIDGADGPDPDKTPLSRGLQAIAQGFRLTTENDYDSLEKQWAMYDALYAYCCMRAVRERYIPLYSWGPAYGEGKKRTYKL